MKNIKSSPTHGLIAKLSLALAVTGVLIAQGSAAMVMNLRATHVNALDLGGGSGVFGGGVTNLAVNQGDVVTFSLFATVTGTQTANTAQGFQSGYGTVTIAQAGGATGNWTSFTNPNGVGAAGGTNLLGAFGGSGAQTGTIQAAIPAVTGKPGVGSLLNGATTNTDTNLIFLRAGAAVTAAAPAGSQALVSGDLFTTEILLGQLQLTIGSIANSNSTLVSFARAIFPSGSVVIWRENGLAKNQASAGTSYTDSPGVTLTTVPEPAAFGMLALGALGLVGFRRARSLRTA